MQVTHFIFYLFLNVGVKCDMDMFSQSLTPDKDSVSDILSTSAENYGQ